jgi:hypothetical protein
MKTIVARRRKRRIISAMVKIALVIVGILATFIGCFILLASPGGIMDSIGILAGLCGCAAFAILAGGEQ